MLRPPQESGGDSSRISGLWELRAQLRKELSLYAWTHVPCVLAATALEAAKHPLKCVQALNTGSCRVQIMASLPTDHTITSLAAHTLRAGPERRDGHSALGT